MVQTHDFPAGALGAGEGRHWGRSGLRSRGAARDSPRAKRLFDVALAVALLPVLALAALALVLLNPLLNPGPLLIAQARMGQGCTPFRAFKFRSMRGGPMQNRTVHAPLERARITPLGGLLRRTRLDELPQLLNVLRGEMSLIGPRPDLLEHAHVHLATVPGYRARHAVRPGISGFAQVVHGYAETPAELRRKVAADLHYIANRDWRLEGWILWRTIVVVLAARGM